MRRKHFSFALLAMLLSFVSPTFAQVAKIGDTEYATIDDAVAAAQNGGTIILIADVVELTAQVVIPEGKVLTLDLNGKTVNSVFNGTSTTNHIYALSNNGTLTIQDSKGNGSINSRGIYNYGSLTLNAGAINAIDGNGGYAVNNQSGSTFVMNGGVVAATNEDDHQSSSGGYDATALKVPAGCTATLNGGTINDVCDFTYAIDAAGTLNIPATSTITVNGTHGAIYVSGGETTINAGTFQIPADEYSRTDNVLYVSGGSLVVNGGTFIGDSDTASGGSCLCDTKGTAVVNGGTFKGSSGGDVWGTTGTTIKGGTFENLTEKQHVAAGYEMNENGEVVEAVKEVKVATLAELQAALADNSSELPIIITETIVIPEGETVVLDLNGKTVTRQDEATNYAINNLGTLTIQDTKGNGSINARGIYNGYGNGGANVATAKITVVNGTINAKGTNGGAAIFNYGSADIQGGNFTSIGGYSLNCQSGASMTIADGVTANNGIYVSGATLVVDGGEISGNRSGYHVLYAWNSNVTIAGGTFHNNNSGNSTTMAGGTTKLTINGGTFSIANGKSTTGWTSCLIDATDGGKYEINGGEFKGHFRVQANCAMEINGGTFENTHNEAYNIIGTAEVKGGTFTDAAAQTFAKNNIADDYKLGEDGKVVYAPAYVAMIGETKYETLEAAFAAATEDATIVLLADATPALASQRAITKAAVIDLGGKTMTLTEDDLYFGTTTFKNGTIVVDPSVKPSTAVFWMFANQALTFDNVKVVATGVTGTYLIGLDGNNSDLNLLNGSEILVENTTALDLDIICVNASTGNDIKVENSKVNVTNLDGRVFFRGNYTVKDSEVNLAGITKAGFRIEAGQTLSIEGTSTINIEGEPRDGGIHLTDLSATYTKAETATVSATVNAPAPAYVAMIGEQGYETLAAALEATKTMTGDVTVEILDKVTFNQPLIGNYTSITFVGKDTDAEMYLDVQGYTTATGKKVSFTDLKLSKSEGGFIANAGFMNVAFGIYDVEEVTYTNCTFENGACASSGKVTFNGCTFKKSWDKYGLWAYGNVDVTVQGSTFADYRGIKMYAENGAAASVEKANLTVKNTNFSAVDNKPAIVLTYGESVVLEGNTYSSTGTFELDLDGKPNGVAVTSDVAPVCVNDNGACGVLVDGKIYTTVAQAAEVATETSTITLLHSSNETVEFPMGTTIDKNGFTADNVTTAQPFAEYVVLPISMTVNNYKAMFGTNTVTDGTNYYATMAKALEGIHKGTATVLYCKPGADLGTMTHGHVCRSLTIYGNGAKISGGEQDFELDTYKFCHSSSNTCEGITAEVNLTVKHLDGCGAWGQRTTGNTLNIVFEECKDMNRVYISGTTGINNITLTNCSFLGTVQKQCTLYSNANGQVNVTGTTFSGIYAPVNLNHKVAGTQVVNVENCAFTDCGTAEYDYAAPVRVLSSVEGAQSTLTVNNTTFTGTKANKLGQTADILLDYGVGTTEAAVKNTAANVVVEKENNVGTKTEVSADNDYEFTTAKPVAKIGDVEYTSLQAAIEAVQEGEIITLTSDVNVTTPAYGQNALNHARAISFTLDLNGKTLSANTGNSVFRFNITQTGATSDVTLTIKNGTIKTGASTWCSVMAAGISKDVKAVMELEDLTITASKAGDLAVKAWDYATIKAKGVTVNTTNGAGGFYAVGGEIILNECTVNQKGLHTAPYLSMAFAVSSNGKMTVNSGTYSAEPTAAAEGNNQGTTHGSWVGGVMNSGGTLIINGGTFSNGNFGDDALATAARGLIFGDTKANIEIKGGTFNALKSIFDFQNNLGSTSPVFTIYGGTYSANPSVVTSYGSVTIADGYSVVENNGVWTVAEAGLAGEGTEANPYLISSIDDLILFRNSVNEGVANKYNASGVWVALGADIDLAGENWIGIGSATKDHGFMGNFDGQGYKIKNLTITNPALDSDGYAYAGLFSVTEGTDQNNQNTIKNLTIENVTINTTGHIVSAAIAYPYCTIVDNVKVCGNIDITGGDYTAGALAYTRRCLNASNVKVAGAEGSTITGARVVGGVISDIQMNGGWIADYSNFSAEGVSITGTEMVGGISGIIATQTLNGASVKNVTLTSGDSRVGVISGSLGGVSTITGVTYDNVEGATAIVGPTYKGANLVEARIGDTYYATLDAALAAEGNEIELLAPITIAAGETKTLDLKGKTVTMVYTQTATKNHTMISNSGNLTIESSVEGGKLSYTYAGGNLGTTYSANTVTSNPGSVLTVKSGTIENLTYDSGIIAYAIDGLTNGGAGDVTVNIEGGVITSKRQAVRIFANSTTNTGALNISGGEFTGRVIVQNASAKANKAALNITDGTFNANEYKTDVLYLGGNHSATIDINASVSGGTFKGEITETNVKGFISGGTFTTDVTAFCADGFVVKANGDGTYGIAEAPAVTVPDNFGEEITDEEEKEVVSDVVNEIVENEAVNNFEPEVPAEVKEFEITLTAVEVADEKSGEDTVKVTTKVTYNVEPIDADGNKVATPSDTITFRLPIPSAWSGKVRVYHAGELMGTYPIIDADGAKYVEVTSASFSEFSVEMAYREAMTINHSDYRGGSFTNDFDLDVEELTYIRELTAVDTWNALYVPFEIPVTEDFLENYTVAYFNDVHSYDKDFNGVIDSMVMELIRVQEGQTLNANYPYLIKAKNEESKTINFVMNNVTVYKATETTINCTSVFMKYELTGSYTTRTAGELKEGGKYNVFAMSSGTWRNAESDDVTLNPFLLHLRLSSLDGSPVKVSPAALRSISISVIGEEPTADEAEPSVENNFIYDVLGRRVLEPQKGVLYIMNGKKVIF